MMKKSSLTSNIEPLVVIKEDRGESSNEYSDGEYAPMKTREKKINEKNGKSSARGFKSNLNFELPSLLVDKSMNSGRSKNSARKNEEEKKLTKDYKPAAIKLPPQKVEVAPKIKTQQKSKKIVPAKKVVIDAPPPTQKDKKTHSLDCYEDELIKRI